MGRIIVLNIILLLFAFIFYKMYTTSKTESYGEDYTKDLPSAEGVVTVVDEGRFTKYVIEFKVNGVNYKGESIFYKITNRKYWIGDEIKFWYTLKKNPDVYDARIVIQDSDLISCDKHATSSAKYMLVVSIMIVGIDIIATILMFLGF